MEVVPFGRKFYHLYCLYRFLGARIDHSLYGLLCFVGLCGLWPTFGHLGIEDVGADEVRDIPLRFFPDLPVLHLPDTCDHAVPGWRRGGHYGYCDLCRHPTVRYTIIGLRGIPSETIEAAITSGCTPRQVLWKVRLPLAIPEIMLGANQTVMFALFMVIIAAFIGTRDLGQEIFRALTFNDAGKGLVVGLCVAFIGLTVDRLITAWADERKKILGLA